jgi:glutaminyl-peptide cyclotransferase
VLAIVPHAPAFDGIGHATLWPMRAVVAPAVTRTALTTALSLGAALSLVLAAGCTAAQPAGGRPPAPERLKVSVLEVRPHDSSAFTEGFELVDGVLYEGTGLVGRSAMLATDPVTGAVRQREELPSPLFGEGITVVGPRIWQLTWRNGVAIERDRATFAERRRVSYQGEGWGLCHDGTRLIMSNGTDRLTFRDPTTFAVLGEVQVRLPGEDVGQLNELDCSGGAVWANVWRTDRILRINPGSGLVTGVVDASGLLAAHTTAADRASVDVLNGIAAIPDTPEFLITGKRWPVSFRVTFCGVSAVSCR